MKLERKKNVETEEVLIEIERDYPVYKENELARFCHDLSLMEAKIFSFICSVLNPEHPSENFEYEVSVNQYMKVMGISNSGKNYELIKAGFKKLADKSIWVPVVENGKHGEEIVRCLDAVTVFEKSGTIKFTIGKLLRPYLYNLNHFIKYSLRYVLVFTKKHSVHLYEILKSYEYKKDVDVDLESLKDVLLRKKDGTRASGYDRYPDFRKRILEPCIDEINKYSDIYVTYKAHSVVSKKKFDTITFYIKSKGDRELLHTWVDIDNALNRTLQEEQVPGQYSLVDYIEMPEEYGEEIIPADMLSKSKE